MFRKITFLMMAVLVWLAAPAIADVSEEAEYERFRSEFSGKTIRFDEENLNRWRIGLPEHLNKFIVYFDPSDTAYVWFPGQPIVRSISWEARTKKYEHKAPDETEWKSGFFQKLCLVGFPVRNLHCSDPSQLEIVIQEVAEGDIFNLRSMTIPCRLCRADADFATARKTTGGS